jgi:hypothetical protein
VIVAYQIHHQIPKHHVVQVPIQVPVPVQVQIPVPVPVLVLVPVPVHQIVLDYVILEDAEVKEL